MPPLREHASAAPVGEAFAAFSRGDAAAPVVVFQLSTSGDVHVKSADAAGHEIFVVKIATWFAAKTERDGSRGARDVLEGVREDQAGCGQPIPWPLGMIPIRRSSTLRFPFAIPASKTKPTRRPGTHHEQVRLVGVGERVSVLLTRPADDEGAASASASAART